MKTAKEFAKKLIKYKEINEQATAIIKLQNEIEMKQKKYPHLMWNNNQFRFFLENTILLQENFKMLPLESIRRCQNEIQKRLDLFFPISISNYRYDNDWKDTDLFIDDIYKEVTTILIKPRWDFRSHEELEEEEKDKITFNIKIIQKYPLIESEVNHLEKRLIYTQCGGITNVEDINIISAKIKIKNVDVEKKFLSVKPKELIKCKTKNYFTANAKLIYFESVTYDWVFEKYGSIEIYCERKIIPYKDFDNLKMFINEKFKTEKTWLFLIKDNEKALTNANNFIENWKKEVLNSEKQSLRDFISEEFKNLEIEKFYNDCKEKAVTLCLMQQDLIKGIQDLELEVCLTKIFNSKEYGEIKEIFSEIGNEIINQVKKENLIGYTSVSKILFFEIEKIEILEELKPYENLIKQTGCQAEQKKVISELIQNKKEKLIEIETKEKSILKEFRKLQKVEFKKNKKNFYQGFNEIQKFRKSYFTPEWKLENDDEPKRFFLKKEKQIPKFQQSKIRNIDKKAKKIKEKKTNSSKQKLKLEQNQFVQENLYKIEETEKELAKQQATISRFSEKKQQAEDLIKEFPDLQESFINFNNQEMINTKQWWTDTILNFDVDEKELQSRITNKINNNDKKARKFSEKEFDILIKLKSQKVEDENLFPVIILHRNDIQDHQGGRPAISLGYDQTLKKQLVIPGTTRKIAYYDYYHCKLNNINTYFYLKNSVLINENENLGLWNQDNFNKFKQEDNKEILAMIDSYNSKKAELKISSPSIEKMRSQGAIPKYSKVVEPTSFESTSKVLSELEKETVKLSKTIEKFQKKNDQQKQKNKQKIEIETDPEVIKKNKIKQQSKIRRS